MSKITNNIITFIENIASSCSKLLVLLILCIVFVFLIDICICFLSETLCLQANQFEIILTFVGIIGTFIVVTNFQQVQDSKELAKKEIEEIKITTTKEIEQISQQYNLIKEFIVKSKEYIVAKKMVEQQNLPFDKKEVWHLEVIQNRAGIGKGFKRHEVRIECISLGERDELIWDFRNTENVKLDLQNSILSAISIETIEIDDFECKFDDQEFINWLKVLLKSKQ